MPENTGRIAPIDWRALVAEAIRRRKSEKLTQREHAALASVSIPTIAAFERGERTLTLAKAFDILRVVGLVKESAGEGAQEAFVRDAFDRWRTLTSELPKDSYGRFPHGFYRIDYALDGNLKQFALHQLEAVLRQAEVRYTAWPVFRAPPRQEIAPYEMDGTLECWLSPNAPTIERSFLDAAHCDFWRATPEGRMFLIRGYQEDGQETFDPRTVFDTTLPIWRMGEGLVHASRLAALLKASQSTSIIVKFRTLYTGLLGRVLRPWANPHADLGVRGMAARSDEALVETEAPAEKIEGNLAEYLFPLIASLYERFGVTGLSTDFVQAEVQRLQTSRMHND